MKQRKKLGFLIFWSTCFSNEERNGRLQKLLQLQWTRFELNSRTGQHRTAYYIKSAPHFAKQGLELLADMLIDAQFPQAELEREKGVVIQELKRYQDEPARLRDDMWRHFFF